MEEVKHLTVILKDTDKRLKVDETSYNEINVASSDATIKELVAKAKNSFKGNPDTITIKIELDYYEEYNEEVAREEV